MITIPLQQKFLAAQPFERGSWMNVRRTGNDK